MFGFRKNTLKNFKKAPVFTKLRRIVLTFVDKKPLLSFFIILGILLALILASHLLPKAPIPPQAPKEAKLISTYHIGQAPRLTVQAQVKKTGVIKINALTGGVVNRIYKIEGGRVKKGDLLVSMGANYKGGNPLTVTRQIADVQYKNVLDTYPIQKDIIQKQRDLANKTDENSDQLRDINAKSISETQSLIDLNNQILNSLDQTIADPSSSAASVLSARQLRSQFLAANNQAQLSLRTTQYNTAGDKPPAQISDITREVTLKQLDIQEKQLNLNKEVSRLQLLVAQINESLYFPTAPFNGVVQRVLVKEGESVTPGTPLMIIAQNVEDDPISAIAFVSRDVAQRVSLLEPSTLHLDGLNFDVFPMFVSSEAVQGTLYAVYYPLPDSLSKKVTDTGFISVDIPVGYPDTSTAALFIPLDSIYQTQDKSYIYVVNNDQAEVREVNLGQVYGRYVEVISGINGGDSIILDRTVVQGDRVKTN